MVPKTHTIMYTARSHREREMRSEPNLLVWVPDHLLDVLCVVVKDTGTLILLPLLHHWTDTD